MAAEPTTSDRLEQALRMVVAASHDLRGGLGQLLGTVKTLHARWPDLQDGKREALLDVSVRQLELFARRLDDILALASLSVPPEERAMDLRVVTELVADEAEVIHAGRQFDLQLGDEPVTVFADPARLRRVLGALIDNALKYSDGPVLVRVERAEHEAHVRVRDRGRGISPDALEQVFRPFFRVADGDGEPQGIGLGLFLARAFAEDLGGGIAVESQVAKGSTFTLRLPV